MDGEVGLERSLLWHPDLHRQVVHETLAFLTVGFNPRYQRAVALQVIDRAAAVVGVRSFTVWELQRKPDLLLKVWLPAGKTTDDFIAALREQATSSPHVQLTVVSSAFQVVSALLHHLWPRSLSPADLDEALELGGDLLTSSDGIPTDAGQLETLLRRQIAAYVDDDPAGIKFFIWLSVAELVPSEQGRTLVEQSLLDIVSRSPDVFAVSIYSGSSDSGARYLVTGRFKTENYETLARDLQPRIAALGEPFIAVNTDTALSTLFAPIDRAESLLEAAPLQVSSEDRTDYDRLDVESLLLMEESDRLEFKGSAFTPVGARPHDNPEAQRNLAKKVSDGITRTCVGFLNAGGGQLVIGVLEADRFSVDDARAYCDRAVNVGRYQVVGIDRAVDGRPVTWDEFERRLRSLLSANITPSPDPWLRIVKAEVQGLVLAIVETDEPPLWFWAKTSTETDVFYVRYGNATRPLRGPALVHHMKSSNRDG